jgi:hypothetical protein
MEENLKNNLKKKLKRNETTTDLSEFNISKSILDYVYKSLEHLPNIENLIWPSGFSQKDDLEPVKKLVNKRLLTNRNMFKELKQELVKNDSTTDLRQFNELAVVDTETFLVYVLKSLEMLKNITAIEWPDVCLSLSEKTQKNLLEKIEDRLDENLKRNKNKDFTEKNNAGAKFKNLVNPERGNIEDGINSREKLIEKIKHYEKFPNDYRYCVFSRHVYLYGGKATLEENNKELRVIDETATNHLKENFNKLYEDGWRVGQVQIVNGFKSVLYINETRKQLVLAFKGVQLELKDLFLEGKIMYIRVKIRYVLMKILLNCSQVYFKRYVTSGKRD